MAFFAAGLGGRPCCYPCTASQTARFTDPNLKPFFDALQRESPTWRNAFKHYPFGHFDVYRELNPAVFEQVMSDQVSFLRGHLLPGTRGAASVESASSTPAAA